MEVDIVIPSNPLFYKRCLDDWYLQRKKNETDKLFIDLNSYHENMKLASEINSEKFLDTEIIRTDQGIKTQVYNGRKSFHWSLKAPIKHKRNAITGENTIKNFKTKKDEFIIPLWLFDERKLQKLQNFCRFPRRII